MLDQSYNLDCFWVMLLFQAYICFLNHCFKLSKNLMLSFIDKITTGTQNLLFKFIITSYFGF